MYVVYFCLMIKPVDVDADLDTNVVQWNLIITRSLGPWKLPCYIRFLIISGQKNKET